MDDIRELSGESKDILTDNIQKLKELFPEVVTEDRIDFEQLKEVLGNYTEDKEERYKFEWHGKSQALRLSQTPSTGTLRPCKEDSRNWENTENLYIEGDNLEVLKLLQKTYHNRIKMIYIDPPYNTGNDFVYPDNYKDNLHNYLEITGQVDSEGNRLSTNSDAGGQFHTKWLNMMYPRLRLARNLLRDDGVIFISIDEKEMANLRKICDEIFGQQNYAGEIIWKNSSKNDQQYISIQHEYIVCYLRDKKNNLGDWKEKKQGLESIYEAFSQFYKKHGDDWKEIHTEALNWYKQFPESNPISSSKHYSWMDENGVYFPDNIAGPNFGQYRYDVTHPLTDKICKEPSSGWRYPKETMEEKIRNNLIHFGNDETTVPNKKTYLKNTEFQSLTSVKYKDGRIASKNLKQLLGNNYFNNPKDVDLLLEIAKAINIKDGDIILDFFSGSGTIGEMVIKLGSMQTKMKPKFILIQLPENLKKLLETADSKSKKMLKNSISFLHVLDKPLYLSEIGKERIRRAGDKIVSELKEKQTGQKTLTDTEETVNPEELDIGFKVFKLDSSNLKKWNPDHDNLQNTLESMITNIVDGRSEEDLLYEIMLKFGIDLTYPIETEHVEDKNVYNIGKGALFICLDKNITKEVATFIASKKDEINPEVTRVVFRDNGFASDADKTNIVHILKHAGIEEIMSV